MNINTIPTTVRKFFVEHLSKVSSETLGWLSVIVLHAATIPGFLALMSGLTDRVPSLDLVLFIWSALALLFVRAVVLRDMLNIITIGVGFMVQAILMALLFFR